MDVTEQRRQVLIRRALRAAAIVIPILIGYLLLARPNDPAPAVLWQVPDFSLIDQNAQPFHHEEMRGHVWVAGFVYTHCPDVCPMITQRMAALRDSLRNEKEFGSAVRFASFTVDPDRDTPDVLRAYASSFGVADASEWRFLTGPSETMLAVINGGFYLNAGREDEAQDAAGASASEATKGSAAAQAHVHEGEIHAHGESHAHDTPALDAGGYMVGHSDRLVLIDAQGQVRGTYISSDPEAMTHLRRDLGVLVRSR